ncbi:MAG: hypothetical protein SFW64_08700 [Alphaproteobacteria bacterium]|nr:hypothetical protein [Alphaproteobacteria bacterium]
MNPHSPQHATQANRIHATTPLLPQHVRPQGELFHEPLPRQLPVYKFGPEDEATTMPATRH